MRILDPRSRISAGRKLAEFVEASAAAVQREKIDPLIASTMQDAMRPDSGLNVTTEVDTPFMQVQQVTLEATPEQRDFFEEHKIYSGLAQIFEVLGKGKTAKDLLDMINFDDHDPRSIERAKTYLTGLDTQEALFQTDAGEGVSNMHAWQEISAVTNLFVSLASQKGNAIAKKVTERINSFVQDNLAENTMSPKPDLVANVDYVVT